MTKTELWSKPQQSVIKGDCVWKYGIGISYFPNSNMGYFLNNTDTV